MKDFEKKIRSQYADEVRTILPANAWSKYIAYESAKEKQRKGGFLWLSGVVLLAGIAAWWILNPAISYTSSKVNDPELSQQIIKYKEPQETKITIENTEKTQNNSARTSSDFKKEENTFSSPARTSMQEKQIQHSINIPFISEPKQPAHNSEDKNIPGENPALQPIASINRLPVHNSLIDIPVFSLPKLSMHDNPIVYVDPPPHWSTSLAIGTGSFDHPSIYEYKNLMVEGGLNYFLSRNLSVSGYAGLQQINYTAYVQNSSLGIRSVNLPTQESLLDRINNQVQYLEVGAGIRYRNTLVDRIDFSITPRISYIREISRDADYSFSNNEGASTMIQRSVQDNPSHPLNLAVQAGLHYQINPFWNVIIYANHTRAIKQGTVVLPNQNRVWLGFERSF